MKNNKKKDNLLSTWKEIASYLNCTDRTCRRWEAKCGLPVHRIDGSPKSKVFALKEELDDWLQNRKQSSREKIHFIIKKKILLPFIIAVPFIAIVTLALMTNLKQKIPTEFKIIDSTFIVLNKKGKPLWKYDTKVKNLLPENKYKEYAYRPKLSPHQKKTDFIIFEDLDQDNRIEVLFNIHTKDKIGGGKVVCFDQNGTILWEIQTGQEMTYGEKSYSADYKITYMHTDDVDQDGDQEILLVAAHRIFFPTQFLLLDHTGKILGKYWNSGRIKDFNSADIDKDGKKEILIAGCNNAFNKAFFSIFDYDNINGFSPEAKRYSNPDFQPGTEKFYILLPIDYLTETRHPRGSIDYIDVQSNKSILLREYHSSLYYELDSQMRVIKIFPSDKFRMQVKSAIQKGLITREINDSYLISLTQQTLYWTGQEWINTPTHVKR